MPTKEALELVQNYGLGMFFAVAVLTVAVVGGGFLIRWILKSSDKREDRCDEREKANTAIINTGLAAVTANLQTVVQTLGNIQSQQIAAQTAGEARYAILMKAQEMQRIEHASMLERLNGVHENVKEIECQGALRRSTDHKSGG